jgi:hypothetical protein
MSRRELKMMSALCVAVTLAVSGVMVGLRSLGAPDELTAVLMVGVFAFGLFFGSFLLDDSPPDHR